MYLNLFYPPSSIKSLKKLMSSKQVSILNNATSDWRLLYGFSADELGLSENQLMYGLSQMLKLEFSRLKNYEYLDEKYQEIKMFFSCGALPIFDGDRIIGAYCIDPLRLRSLLLKRYWKNIIITTWSDIVETYYNIKKEIKFTVSNPILLTIFESIIDEAKLFSVKEIMFFKKENYYEYSFFTNDGKEAVGEVSQECSEQLDLFFEEAVEFNFIKVANQIVNLNFSNNIYKFKLDYAVKNEFIKPKTILHIEDDELFSELVKYSLTKRGFEYLHCKSGYNALKKFVNKSFKPDLIISDYFMPNGSGGFFLKELKRIFADRNIPIIVLSSADKQSTNLDFADLNISHYLLKSERPEVLVNTVCSLVD